MFFQTRRNTEHKATRRLNNKLHAVEFFLKGYFWKIVAVAFFERSKKGIEQLFGIAKIIFFFHSHIPNSSQEKKKT